MSEQDCTPNPPLKRCTKCNNEYPATLEYYHRHVSHRDGLRTICKTCTRKDIQNYAERNADAVRERRRQYRANNREILREKNRQYQIDNAEKEKLRKAKYRETHRELLRQKNRQYYSTNLEVRRSQNRKFSGAYYRNHAAERIAYSKQWRKMNPQKHKAAEHRRRAYKQNTPVDQRAFDEQAQLKHQKHRCYYCGGLLVKYHIDHIIPLSRGGGDNPENKVLACPQCNQSKGSKLPHEWTKGGRLL